MQSRRKRRRRTTASQSLSFQQLEPRRLLAVAFADSFENGQWNGLWVEDSQNDWFTSTKRVTDGNYAAEIDGSANNATLTVANPIDLSLHNSAELTFDWFIESSWDSGEYIKLDFWDGSTWNEIRSLDGNVDQENVWHSEQVQLDPQYLNSDFKFRYRAKVSRSSEDGHVDNVQLIATPVETVQVYLMVGQSNMAGYGNVAELPSPYDVPQSDVWIWQDDLAQNVGWTPLRGGFNDGSVGNGNLFGPEVTFGRTLADAQPDANFAIIKHVGGGTGATMQDGWSPNRVGGTGPGQIWTDFIGKSHDSLANLDANQISYEIAGLIVAQGARDMGSETGVEAANYQENLTQFISGVRQEFGVPELPVVIARSADFYQATIYHDGSELVRTAQEAVAAADPLTTIIQADDLSRLDFVHFDSDGQLTFGERIGNAILGEPFEGSAKLGTDSFETGDFSGGYEQWSTGAWMTAGDVSVTATSDPFLGNYNALLQGDTAELTRTVDVAGLSNLRLRMVSRLDSFEPSDKALVKVSGDGVNWTTLQEFVDGQDDNEYIAHELVVPNVGDTLYLRFDAAMDGLDDYWYVDVIKLTGTLPAGPANAAPVVDIGGPYEFDEGGNVTLDASSSIDPDGAIVSYAWDFDGDGQYDDANGVTVNYTATASGAYTIGLQVTDDDGAASTTTTSATVNNVAPTALAGGTYSGNEGSTIAVSASGSNDPGNDIVGYAWDLDNDGQYDDATGETVNFQSTADGNFTVGLRVTDADGATGTATAQVTVANVAPTADAGGPYTVQENDIITLSAAGSTDPGNDIVSYDWDLNNDGVYEATGITASFSESTPGSYPVSVQVIDDDGASSMATVNVIVTEFNDAPTTSGIANVTVDEDSANSAVNLHATFDDEEDSDSELVFSITANTNPGIFNSTDISGGILTLDYAPDAYGTADLTVRAMDTGGKFVQSTFKVTVNPVNDAPVADDESFSTDQDVTLEIAAASLLAGDWDVDGDSLGISGFSQGVEGGSVVDNQDGTYSFTPAYGFFGTDSFTYTVSDGNGGTDIGNATITINEVTNGPNLAFGDVVSSGGWQSVTLPNNYTSMVVVASPNYDKTDVPAVVRVRNAGGNTFEFAVQQATNSASPAFVSGVSVHYTVMEEGVYDNPTDGYKLEAVKFDSTRTDENNSWVGESQTYQQFYSNPVVVGQVMSFNDSDWSVFWAAGGSRTSAPTSGALTVGKHVGEDSDVTRANETIGYFVIEATNDASIEGLPIAAGVTNDFVRGTENVTNATGYQYDYGISFNSKAAVASNAGMDGGDGGWAVLYGDNPVDPFSSKINLAIDEDQIANSERKHTTEQVAYFVVDPPLVEFAENSEMATESVLQPREELNLGGLVGHSFELQSKDGANSFEQSWQLLRSESPTIDRQLAGATTLDSNHLSHADEHSIERISAEEIKDSVFANLSDADFDLLTLSTGQTEW